MKVQVESKFKLKEDLCILLSSKTPQTPLVEYLCSCNKQHSIKEKHFPAL